MVNPDFTSKRRYARRQWSHGPKIQTHAGPGDTWKFSLTGMEVLPGITFVPMPGHTKGHALHAGDAVFDGSSFANATPSGTPLTKVGKLRMFEKAMAVDRKKLAGNHATLSRLNGEDGVTVFNAHDKRIFDDIVSA